MLAYNKVVNIDDFRDPEIRDLIRDIYAHELELFPPEYPDGVADSKQWEIAMAVRTLRKFGCLEGKRLLGIGAGTEITSFYLTRMAREVVATDIYANAHVWADVAPLAFLADPSRFSPIRYQPERLIPVHMDARLLRLPDNSFDGVFSSGSIEHFGSLEYVANAAYEIGRVLKPGGVATIATEFKLAGPPDGDGWDPNVILFSPEKLKKYIVDASGLELVDTPDHTTTAQTLEIRRDLLQFLEGTKGDFDPKKKIAHYPNLVLYYEGYLFCSVHLALRKPDKPKGDNSWAAPGTATREAVSKASEKAVSELGGTLLRTLGDAAQAPAELPYLRDRVAVLSREWESLTQELAETTDQLAAANRQATAAHQTIAELSSERVHIVNEYKRALQAEEEKVQGIVNSISWRVTRPLRAVYSALLGR